MPRFVRPALVAALVFASAACDSSSSDVQPLGGRLYVSLSGSTQMTLESDLDLPCGPRIATEQQLSGGRFQVNVLGIEAPDGMCDTVAPVRRTITLETGGAQRLPVDIRFGGEVDEYAYDAGIPGRTAASLDSVRTTVTLPGPRPR